MKEGDLVVLTPGKRLSNLEYETLRASFAALVERDPKLRGVLFLLAPTEGLEPEILTVEQRRRLAEELARSS